MTKSQRSSCFGVARSLLLLLTCAFTTFGINNDSRFVCRVRLCFQLKNGREDIVPLQAQPESLNQPLTLTETCLGHTSSPSWLLDVEDHGLS